MGYKLSGAYIGTQRVRPQQWHPSSHTILYCPLDTDTNDATGNHTMTVNTNYGGLAKDNTGFYYFSGGILQTSDSYYGPAQGTLSAWFNKAGRGGGGATTEWAISTHRGDSLPYHTFAMNLGTNDTFTCVYTSNNSVVTIYPGNPPLNQRFLWTLTYSSTDGAKLYVNGELVGSSVPNGIIYPYYYPTCIGSSTAATYQYYEGYIADVIYEDVVWNEMGAKAYYNDSKSRFGY